MEIENFSFYFWFSFIFFCSFQFSLFVFCLIFLYVLFYHFFSFLFLNFFFFHYIKNWKKKLLRLKSKLWKQSIHTKKTQNVNSAMKMIQKIIIITIKTIGARYNCKSSSKYCTISICTCSLFSNDTIFTGKSFNSSNLASIFVFSKFLQFAIFIPLIWFFFSIYARSKWNSFPVRYYLADIYLIS